MGVMGTIESAFSKVNATVFRQVTRATDWWNLPTPVALLNLRAHRDDLRRHNLYDTEAPRENGGAATADLPRPAPTPARPRPRSTRRWGWSAAGSVATPRPTPRPRSRCRSGCSPARARSP